VGETEPSEPQARAVVTNGVSRELPYEFDVNGRSGSGRIQFDVAHVSWMAL
jgi:hypothetical protein